MRLPKAFAARLFEATENGVTVVIADEISHGPAVVSPGERAPVDAYTGLELQDGLDDVAAESIAGRLHISVASNASE